MKKFIKFQLVILVAFALCIASCSKKNDVPQPLPDYKALLIGKTWSIIKLSKDINANGKIDDGEFYSEPASTYDDITFMADGTALVTHSDGKSTINVVYSWEQSDKKTIKLNNQVIMLTYYWHVNTLTANQFNFDQYLVDNMTLDAGFQCSLK